MSGEFGDDYITITDEEGQSFELEVIHTFDLEGQTYSVFLPTDMEPEDPDYGFIILKAGEDEDGTFFDSIDDEDELMRAYDYYMEELYAEDFPEEEEE